MNRLLITFAVQMFAAWLCVLGVAFYWATQTACGGGAAILGDSSVDASGVNTGRTIDRGGRANGALANARLQHPKVDLLKSEIQEFRNLKNQGAVYKDAYDWLMTYGDKAVARTTEYAYSQKGSWASDLTTCRYAYLASGDAKYAEHAKALALYAAQNWVPASGVTATRDATAEFARTYDTLYDYLSSAERSILLDATRTWGMLLYSEIQKNYKLLMGPMTANSIGYLAEAALVMDGEFAEASTWMDFCVNHYTGTIDGYSWPWYSAGMTEDLRRASTTGSSDGRGPWESSTRWRNWATRTCTRARPSGTWASRFSICCLPTPRSTARSATADSLAT